MTENETAEKDLVYGKVGGSSVFIPRHLAVELGNLRDALHTSRTWGELKSRILAERYEQIISPHFENFYDELDMDVELTLEEAMAEFQSRKTNKDMNRSANAHLRIVMLLIQGLSMGFLMGIGRNGRLRRC